MGVHVCACLAYRVLYIYMYVCNILNVLHFVVIGKPSKIPGHPDYVPSIFCGKKQKKVGMARAGALATDKERKRERDFESVDAANVLVELCKHPRLGNQQTSQLAHFDQCKEEVGQEMAGTTVQSDAETTVCADKQPVVKTEAENSSLELVTDVAHLQANVLALQYENKQLKRQVELLIARNNQLWDEKKADHDFSKDFLALKLANEELKKELESAKMEIKTARFSSFCLNSSFKTFNY